MSGSPNTMFAFWDVFLGKRHIKDSHSIFQRSSNNPHFVVHTLYSVDFIEIRSDAKHAEWSMHLLFYTPRRCRSTPPLFPQLSPTPRFNKHHVIRDSCVQSEGREPHISRLPQRLPPAPCRHLPDPGHLQSASTLADPDPGLDDLQPCQA